MEVSSGRDEQPLHSRAFAVGAFIASAIPLGTIAAAFWVSLGPSIVWQQNLLLVALIFILGAICAAISVFAVWRPVLLLLARKRARFSTVFLGSVLAGLPASFLWILVHALLSDRLSDMIVSFWPASLALPGFAGAVAYWTVERFWRA